jgi:hypothetical protein
MHTATTRDRVYLRETATPERLGHAGDAAVETKPVLDPDKLDRGAPLSYQRVVAAPLDRLRSTGAITEREFNAGDRLRADAYLAAIDPGTSSVDWTATAGTLSGKVPSMFNSQHIADARIRYRDMQKRLTGLLWEVLEGAVVLEDSLESVGKRILDRRDNREATVAGHAGLRMALHALADRYDEGGPRQRFT